MKIRANSLSGDCRWSRELRRGFVAFSKQHQVRTSAEAIRAPQLNPAHGFPQECVRRRAVISVRNNPACPDDAAAERAVNEVWESCFNDTRPFDEVMAAPARWTVAVSLTLSLTDILEARARLPHFARQLEGLLGLV